MTRYNARPVVAISSAYGKAPVSDAELQQRNLNMHLALTNNYAAAPPSDVELVRRCVR